MNNLELFTRCINKSSEQTNIEHLSNSAHKDWEIGKIHNKNPLVYIKIQKNASSFFNEHLVNNWRNINVQTENMSHYQNHDHFVVLRDPIDRWVSGMTTYLTSRYHNGGVNELKIFDAEFPEAFITIQKSKWFKNMFQEFLILSTAADLHTCSQLWFLSFFNLEKINFFFINDKLGYQINKFLHIYNIENKCNNHKINSTPRTSMMYLFLNEMLQDATNTSFKDKLKDIYKYDYEFLQNVDFYAR